MGGSTGNKPFGRTPAETKPHMTQGNLVLLLSQAPNSTPSVQVVMSLKTSEAMVSFSVALDAFCFVAPGTSIHFAKRTEIHMQSISGKHPSIFLYKGHLQLGVIILTVSGGDQSQKMVCCFPLTHLQKTGGDFDHGKIMRLGGGLKGKSPGTPKSHFGGCPERTRPTQTFLKGERIDSHSVHMAVAQKTGTQNGRLVSGNMDQNLRCAPPV